MSLPAYADYKESGIEWLGLIPREWTVIAPKRVIKHESGGTEIKGNCALEPSDGMYPAFSASGQDVWLPSYRYELSGLVLSAVGARCGKTFKADGRWGVVANTQCLIPSREASRDYFWYLTNIENWWEVGGSAQPFVLTSATLDRLFALPPLAEQIQIARFLDHETARIDALIEEQQRLIELLKEKRQAVISHAVTKGLDPTVPTKDSGVEWLGKVPEHWQVGALGYFAGIDTGATPDRGNPEYWGGDIPWIKTGEVNYENISQAEEYITNEGVKNSAAKVAPKGTLLMAMYGQGVTRGRVAILDIEAAYNQACAGIFVDGRIRVEYLRLFFIAAYPYIRDGGNETSQMNLSSGHIAKIKITVPPIDEQISAENFINAEIARFDSLINEVSLLANHLQERRSALISAVVTGKIDVRGWQPPASTQALEPAVAEAV